MTQHHDYDALPTNAHAPTWKQERRVLAVVGVFVLLLEIIARIIAPHLDYDREHIHRFPQIIQNLEKRAEKSGRPRVIFFGNSLMMHGLKTEIVTQELKNSHDSVKIEATKITPVGTAILDWVYLYKRYFRTPNSHPDVFVMGFVAHHITDQEPIKLRRLARHFVATPDLPDLWKFEHLDFHNITQSILCNISALEGDQPEHQLGILYTLVPCYKEGVKRNNRLITKAAERRAKEVQPTNSKPKQTYRRLERFLKLCKQHGTQVWLIPMPQPEVWDYNPAVTRLAEKYGMKVLDARQIPGMTEKDFSDGYHLGESGAEKFSQWMAEQMAKSALRKRFKD